MPFSGDLPNLGIKSGSPALQADSLPPEPPGKPYFHSFHCIPCLDMKLNLDVEFIQSWVRCYCLVSKLCLTLCDPMDCSMPGSSVLHYLPAMLC